LSGYSWWREWKYTIMADKRVWHTSQASPVSPPGSFREMRASFSFTFTAASRPSTSLTAVSVSLTALVTAAQRTSSPWGARPLWPLTSKPVRALPREKNLASIKGYASILPMVTLV